MTCIRCTWDGLTGLTWLALPASRDELTAAAPRHRHLVVRSPKLKSRKVVLATDSTWFEHDIWDNMRQYWYFDFFEISYKSMFDQIHGVTPLKTWADLMSFYSWPFTQAHSSSWEFYFRSCQNSLGNSLGYSICYLTTDEDIVVSDI